MRAVSRPLVDTAGPMSYLDADQIHMDPSDPLPFTTGGALLKDLGEETAADLLKLNGEGSDCPLPCSFSGSRCHRSPKLSPPPSAGSC